MRSFPRAIALHKFISFLCCWNATDDVQVYTAHKRRIVSWGISTLPMHMKISVDQSVDHLGSLIDLYMLDRRCVSC